MKELSDILTWQQNFGLLPVHLHPTLNEQNFLLLNGGHGDFCLQIHEDGSEQEDYYSKSWSSNTKNFVVLSNENVIVLNWARKKTETIPQSQVTNNFDKFYKYLISKSYKSEKDVVPFIIDIFRQLRNITQEKTNPVEALNLLFVLLTSLEDDYQNFDLEKWNVNEVSIPEGFDFYTERIQMGIENIRPQFDLIVRHASGVLFQEAQKEVLFFSQQRELFGGISNKIETKNNLYSSIHYTPPYLARAIVENSLRHINLQKENIRIFDPACGSSEFLIEALKQLKELNYHGKIEIKGWDSSETAISTSKFLLKYEQRTVWGDKLNFEVKLVDDSLTEEWDADIDLILMNPPFVSWELLKKDSRDAIKTVLGINFTGKPNQASAFFVKSIESLSNEGVIGCVIPSSFLTLDSYKKLRTSISDLITINLIGKLGNFVFEDALADVSLIIGKKPSTQFVPTILWTKNDKGLVQSALRDLRKMHYSNTSTVNERDYSIFQPVTFPLIHESWKPISLQENELLKKIGRFLLEKRLVRVIDVFDVRQGINSGNNNLFKVTKSEYLELPESEQKFFRPVIDNKAIKNGQLFDWNYIWYPYDQNGILLKTEEEFNLEAPVFFNKLFQYREDLASRGRKDETNWWYLSEHRSWLLKPEPRLVSTRFGNSTSFAFDFYGQFVVENGNAWIPARNFDDLDEYFFYLAIFSSPFFDKLLSIYSRQLSGGNWYDLGKKYSKNIPIPNINLPEAKNSNGYITLVEMGRQLTSGNTYVRTASDEVLLKYFYPEILL